MGSIHNGFSFCFSKDFVQHFARGREREAEFVQPCMKRGNQFDGPNIYQGAIPLQKFLADAELDFRWDRVIAIHEQFAEEQGSEVSRV